MRIKSELLKLLLAALGLASALSGSGADTTVTSAIKATPFPEHFPRTGLQLWLSAGQVEQTDGVVTALKDLSGNENHAWRDPASANPATNPALAKEAASGQPVLRFSGANIAFAFKRITVIRFKHVRMNGAVIENAEQSKATGFDVAVPVECEP